MRNMTRVRRTTRAAALPAIALIGALSAAALAEEPAAAPEAAPEAVPQEAVQPSAPSAAAENAAPGDAAKPETPSVESDEAAAAAPGEAPSTAEAPKARADDAEAEAPAKGPETAAAEAPATPATPETPASPAPPAEAKAAPAAKPEEKKAQTQAAPPAPEATEPGGLVEEAPDTWSGGVSVVVEGGGPPLAAVSALLGDLYKNEDEGFELRPPAGWAPGEAPGFAVAFRGPPQEGFEPILTVEIMRGGGGASIEATVAERKRHNATDLSNYDLALEHYSRSRGRPAAVLSGTFVSSGLKLRNYQVIVDEGARKSVLTFVVLESDFDRARKAFRESALSFDWSDARAKRAPPPAESFVTIE